MRKSINALLLGAAVVVGAEPEGKGYPVYNSFVTSLQVEEFEVGGMRTKWKLRPTVTIPALRIESSHDTDSYADVSVFSSVGGGVSLSLIRLDTNATGKSFESLFSFSPMTVLLSSRYTDREKSVLDIALAATAGLFDDKFMLGIGYNFGRNRGSEGWERCFLLLGLGVNFN